MRWQEWLILKDEHLAPPKQKLKMIYLPAPPTHFLKTHLGQVLSTRSFCRVKDCDY